MNVKIIESGKIETLGIIDSASGVNWVSDLIGNTGAFDDGQFTWSEEDDAYLATQDTYDWWARYIADSEATEAEVEALAAQLGIDAGIIRERIAAATTDDYELHRRQAQQVLREFTAE